MFLPRNLICFLLMAGTAGSAQSAGKPDPYASQAGRKAIALAEAGRCTEALPALRKSIHQLTDKDLERKAGLAGVRCAMTLGQMSAALDLLQVLNRDFPQDPDVLYADVHAFSDLSTHASQELAKSAPSSYQAHELLADSFEMQGKWEQAEKEYRAIIQQNPGLPGIHFRLGRLLLSKSNPGADIAEEAKKEFQQEIAIDPANAGAEYVLGELARQSQAWDEAADHFSRTAKLDPKFGEAFLGLGLVRLSQKRYTDAVTPLETAVKLEPLNPDAHYNLAIAYTRSGRKEDGDKEFAMHKQLIGPSGNTAPPDATPQQNQ